jgi:polyketide cyclase/dehydrase/lipid transport protein
MRLLSPLALLFLAAAPRLSLPGEIRPTPTGDVWIEMVSAGPGKPKEGVGRGVVEAPPERVFRALSDYVHWQEWMPFLASSDARPQRDGAVVSEHAMELPSPLGRRRYQVRFTQRGETAPGGGRSWGIDWAFVKGTGNVADHRGSWRLTDLGGGRTLAVCRLYTDPGGFTPRWAMDRGTSQMLPWIFHGLRQQVRRSRYDGP